MGLAQSRFPADGGPRMLATAGYDEEYDDVDSPRYVRGLVNEGQNCFVNATLQVRFAWRSSRVSLQSCAEACLSGTELSFWIHASSLFR